MADLTAPEHEWSGALDEAVRWLSGNPRDRISRPIVPALKAQFGLTTLEAIEVIREANLRNARAG